MLLENANIIREKRKTLKILIDNQGKISIICPTNLPLNKISEILEQKEKLINKKIKNIKKITTENEDIISFKKILLIGKEYFIVPTVKVGKVYFTEDSFIIPKKYIETDKLTFYIKKNLKDVAKKVITKRVEEIYNNFPKQTKKYTKITIGNFKAKWGSCDNLGHIKFNWKLIMLNPNIIDFVIFHELTHLIELNHSKKFYNILDILCENWKTSRQELKKYNFLLTLYN